MSRTGGCQLKPGFGNSLTSGEALDGQPTAQPTIGLTCMELEGLAQPSASCNVIECAGSPQTEKAALYVGE